MRRWIAAVVFLLGGALGLAHGDYIIIIANLGIAKDKDKDGQGQPGPGIARGGPGGGMFGQFGNQGGPRPGFGGGPGGPGMGGGGPRPGFGGGPGGPGMGGMPGFGAGGGPGGPGMGGMPGFGQGGGMPGFGALRAGMEASGFGQGEVDSPLHVMTVIETVKPLTRQHIALLSNGKGILITHKWGATGLQLHANLKASVMPGPDGQTPLPGLAKRYQEKYKAAHKEAPTVDGLIELAEWALGHNMLKEFVAVMGELEKLDKDHPSVKAFHKVQQAMDQPNSKGDLGKVWQERLQQKDRADSAHYVLLYTKEPIRKENADERLKALEDHYKGFFYWFALKSKDGELAYAPKGQTPVVPDQKLVVVLTGKEQEFERQHKIFGSIPMVADGFFSRRDNVEVMSWTRLDKPFKALDEFCGPYFQKMPRDGLIRGSNRGAQGLSQEEFWWAETLAVVHKSLEQDSEVATVTHDGSRQLLASIGLLPRNIEAPEWVQFGFASFFETPKGAPWGGPGGPSWVYLPYYKDWKSKKKDNLGKPMEKPLDALKAVITDRYFREAYREVAKAAKEGKEAKEAKIEQERAEAALFKARAMAWSLTYFLAQKQLDDLVEYHRELTRLPRDLQFDEETLMLTFARAFKCLNDDGRKADDTKLTRLATDWERYMDATDIEGKEAWSELRKNQNELKAGGVGRPQQGNPQPGQGGPGRPGGGPGRPGGGQGGP